MRTSRPIVIVYYIYINPLSNWRAIIKGQLGDLSKFGLIDEAELYVHITDTNQTAGVQELVETLTNDRAVISRSAMNQFEYPAIKLLYDLASSCPDKTFMYLHTKGMSYDARKRRIEEKALLAGTFKNWREHLSIFRNHPTINKIGLFPARTSADWSGWIWFNFFIARGSYLKNCQDPIITTDRYYYEAWIRIANEADPPDDCYSLYAKGKKYFGPEHAAGTLHDYSRSFITVFMTKLFKRIMARIKRLSNA